MHVMPSMYSSRTCVEKGQGDLTWEGGCPDELDVALLSLCVDHGVGVDAVPL
jgi:hypothetical protein